MKLIDKKPLVVMDAPLLYETRLLEYFCYPILVVYTDSNTQLDRLMGRNNLNEKDG